MTDICENTLKKSRANNFLVAFEGVFRYILLFYFTAAYLPHMI